MNDAENDSPIGNGMAIRFCDGIAYVCLPWAPGSSLPRRIHRALRPLRLGAASRRLHLKHGQIKWISIAPSLYSVALHLILKLLLRSRVLLDLVERHDQDQFSRGWLDPYLIRHRYSSWLARHLPDKLIVISTELERSYSEYLPTIVLPPAIDPEDYLRHASMVDSDVLNVLYAGTPSRKDMLGPILVAIGCLSDPERLRIRLKIVGITASQLIAQPGVDADLLMSLRENVEVLGVKSRTQVHGYLRRAHFSILIRPNAGYSNAGFPSKVPESLAAGCPMILNLTSDLGEYVHDGREVLVCEAPTANAIVATLRRALALSDDEWTAASTNARQVAITRFDYHVWARPLADFLSS